MFCVTVLCSPDAIRQTLHRLKLPRPQPRQRQPVTDTAPTIATTQSGRQSTAIRFAEIAVEAGIDFQYRNGEEQGTYTILESLGGGVGVTDLDADGRQDLFLPGGGTMTPDAVPGPLPSVVYRNRSSPEHIQFELVTEQAGPLECPCYSHGALVCDWNNDGFEDIFVTGFGATQLLINLGDGTYREQPFATPFTWNSSAAAGDFDADGVTDFYLTRYLNWGPENKPRL